MEVIISKELLSNVLGIQIEYFCCDESWVEYNNPMISINIYELAHKCKEWAYNELYSLKTYRLGDGWICECMPMSFNKKKEFDGINLEPEAIFKACQWILDNKEAN